MLAVLLDNTIWSTLVLDGAMYQTAGRASGQASSTTMPAKKDCCRPEDGWASKGVVNDTGEAMLVGKGCNSWYVGNLQERIADGLNVEDLPHH